MFEPVVDVSTWQRDINVSKMLAAGTLGMYIKAGGSDKNNGASYTDWRFRENAGKFSERIPCGYYYFFYPHFDGTTQARYFCNLIKSVKWNLPPAVDVEHNPSNANQARFQKELKEFVDIVASELGTKAVIYTRATFWNPNVGNPDWAGEHKLWIAAYSETMTHPWGNQANSIYRPRPWNDWWMWQYSADKNGRGSEFGVATAGIDIDRVNMSKEEFYAFAKWQQPDADTPDDERPIEVVIADPIEEPEDETPPTDTTQPLTAKKGFLRVGYNALRIRSRPTTHEENVVGAARRGYVFTIYKELSLGDDIWWLLELPDGTVGWGARRFHGITYLEYTG